LTIILLARARARVNYLFGRAARSSKGGGPAEKRLVNQVEVLPARPKRKVPLHVATAPPQRRALSDNRDSEKRRSNEAAFHTFHEGVQHENWSCVRDRGRLGASPDHPDSGR